jgi:hypothetical protein
MMPIVIGLLNILLIYINGTKCRRRCRFEAYLTSHFHVWQGTDFCKTYMSSANLTSVIQTSEGDRKAAHYKRFS